MLLLLAFFLFAPSHIALGRLARSLVLAVLGFTRLLASGSFLLRFFLLARLLAREFRRTLLLLHHLVVVQHLGVRRLGIQIR